MKTSFFQKYGFITVLLAVTFLLYSKSLWNEYNIDDQLYYNEELTTQPFFKAITSIFTQPSFTEETGFRHEYRPISKLLFYLEVKLLGKNSFISHTISLLLFTSLLFGLWYLLEKTIQVKQQFIIRGSLILFALHPINTEIICSAKTREEIYVLLFSVIAVLFLYRFQKLKKKKDLFFLLLFYLLALFSKKNGILFLPVYILLYHFWTPEQKIKQKLLFALQLILATVFYIFIHDTLEYSGNRVLEFAENPLVAAQGHLGEMFKNSLHIIGKYIALLAYPHPLSCYYGYPLFQTLKSTTPYFWIGFCSFLIGCPASVYLICKRNTFGYLLLFLLFFLFSLSNCIEVLPGIFADRFAVFPLLFFIPLVVQFITTVEDKTGVKLKKISLIVIAVGFGYLTYARSLEWKNFPTTVKADLKSYPENYKLNMELANYYYKMATNEHSYPEKTKHYQQAKKQYDKTLKILPNNLSVADRINELSVFLGNEKVGRELILKSTAKEQKLIYLNALYEHVNQQNHSTKTIQYLEEILTLEPNYLKGYEILNRLYFKTHQEKKGIALLNKCIQYHPNSPLGYAEMANYRLSQKDTLQALPYIEKAAVKKPYNPGVVAFLIRYYSLKGNSQKADDYKRLQQQMLQQQ